MKGLFKNLSLLGKGFLATRREAGASLVILFFLTFIFTLVLWLAESTGRPEYSLWDALIWVVVKYVDDPAEVAVAPITIFGQVIGTMVGMLGIAIFAVPAGLIGSGLLDAMADDEKNEIQLLSGGVPIGNAVELETAQVDIENIVEVIEETIADGVPVVDFSEND